MPDLAKENIVPKYIILLSQYSLNFGLVGLRENLVRYLILLGLRDTREEATLGVQEVCSRIATLLSLQTLHYPEEFIHQQLSYLTQKQDIRQVASRYYIANSTRTRLEEDAIKTAQVHTNVLDRLFVELGVDQELSDEHKQAVSAALYAFLGLIFASDGERFARIFIDLTLGGAPTDSLRDVHSFLAESGRNISDTALRKKFIDVVTRNLEAPNSAWRDFLGTIAQTYRVMAVLNLGPDISKIQVESLKTVFSEARFFIDTNIVLQLLLPDSPFHMSDVSVMKRLREIGGRFVITEMTKRETVKALKHQQHLMRRVPPIPPAILPKVVEVIREPFVRAYYHALIRNPNTRWEYFFARLEEVPELLKNLYDIDYDATTLDDDLRESDGFENVLLEVLDAFEKLRGRPKSWDAAEHDAFHLFYLSSQQRRSAKQAFFFTADRSLAHITARLPDLGLEYFAIYEEQLLDLTLPFLAPAEARRTAAEVYGDMFACRLTTAMSRTIPIEDLAKLIRPWMEYEGLSEENVVRILQRTYVQKIVAAEGDKGEQQQLTPEAVDAALIESLRAEMQREQRAELEELYQRLKAESRVEIQAEAERIRARFRERLKMNTRIVKYLADRGISTLADVAIGASLLPAEVSSSLAQLAEYGFVALYGVPATDKMTLERYLFNPKAKVRLSTKGHVEALDYVARAVE